jgi:putative oxidoreductase
MKTVMEKLRKIASKADNLVLLLIRLTLAYGFYKPAVMKWKDINAISGWFESMGYPLPTLNAYLAGITEMAGVVLLILGLGTRIISLPLIFVMLVAIFTVHISNGFEAGDNGFEIPLYYILMLFSLVVYGAGKYSIDYLISKKK